MGIDDGERQERREKGLSANQISEGIVARIKDMLPGEEIVLRRGTLILPIEGGEATTSNRAFRILNIVYELDDKYFRNGLGEKAKEKLSALDRTNQVQRTEIMEIIFNHFLVVREINLRKIAREGDVKISEEMRNNYSIAEFRKLLLGSANSVFAEFLKEHQGFRVGSLNVEDCSQIINKLDIEFGKIIAEVKPNLHNPDNPLRASLLLAQRFVDAVLSKKY